MSHNVQWSGLVGSGHPLVWRESSSSRHYIMYNDPFRVPGFWRV